MKYPKDQIEGAKNAGAFDSDMDAKILALDDDEKSRLNKSFTSLQKDLDTEPTDEDSEHLDTQETSLPPDVPLSFFEKILSFLFQVLGIKTVEQFKIDKLLKDVEKDLSFIKPTIFLPKNKRITRAFAHKIHDLFLRLLWMKNLFDLTLNNNKEWENSKLPKTLVEKFFEKLSGINSTDVDSYFSREGMSRIIKQFDDPKLAMETIDKNMQSYLASIDKTLISKVNQSFTELMFFKNLSEYDYISLFRRFDPSFEMGRAPTFNDIPGDAMLSYLLSLEELLMHIDLKLNYSPIFIALYKVSLEAQGDDNLDKLTAEGLEINDNNPLQEDKLLQELAALTEILKELMYKNYFTLIIRMLKQNPVYQPSVLLTSYDLFHIYSETLQSRVKLTAKKIIRSHKQKDLEAHLHKIFPNLFWVGIYSQAVNEDLEKNEYPSFKYSHYMAVIYSFLTVYYKEIMKNSINILLLNGVFSEKSFHKQLSDTFYSMDKFVNSFEEIVGELQADGNTGKKLLSFLNKKISYHTENRKIIEKMIVNMNGKAHDLCNQFTKLFNNFSQLITKVYNDIDAKPPKYVKNIRSIGGFRNVKFLQSIEKSQYIMKNLKTTIHLLQD